MPLPTDVASYVLAVDDNPHMHAEYESTEDPTGVEPMAALVLAGSQPAWDDWVPGEWVTTYEQVTANRTTARTAPLQLLAAPVAGETRHLYLRAGAGLAERVAAVAVIRF